MNPPSPLASEALPYTLLTKEALARLLSVATRTVEAWVKARYLPAPTAIGRRVYWRSDHLQRWLDAHFEGDATQALTSTAETSARAPLGARQASKKPGRPRSALAPELQPKRNQSTARARIRR